MTDITNIPLNKLTAWEGNVRKTQTKGSIDELAANIKAIGLQQNLIVKKDGKKFAVVAGARRLAALQQLAKAGDIEASYEVPCRITEAEDASEISLAENTIRENMHPADECDAYLALIEKGAPLPDVAARFGKTEKYVQQRLKLARVSPKVIKAYRAGELTLEHVQAFAVSDDHKAQEDVLKDFDPGRNDADDIRGNLTENEVDASDRRVKFVTLKAYEKAGGTLRPDLFSDDTSAVIENVELLDTLVAGKMEQTLATVRKEGWKWVMLADSSDYQMPRIFAEPVTLTDDEQKKLHSLQVEYASLDEGGEESEEASERMSDLDKLISEIEDRDGVWTPEQLAMAGVVISIDSQGKPNIQRGLVNPDDMPKRDGKSKKAKASASPSAEGSEPEQEETTGLSAALIESLTAHRTAALSAKMLDYSLVGLQTVVYALVLDIFKSGHSTALCISATSQSLHRVEGSPAAKRLEEQRETWGEKLPGNPDDLWEWCLDQHSDVLIDLLNFCAAASVRAIISKQNSSTRTELVHADKLAKAIELDMTAYFTPTADNYFSRVGKPQILEALAEVDATPPSNSMKKADMARYAEQSVAGKGWLPKIFRS